MDIMQEMVLFRTIMWENREAFVLVLGAAIAVCWLWPVILILLDIKED